MYLKIWFRLFFFVSIISINYCYYGVKQNLENLKNCKLELVNLLVNTESNKDFLFIPKVIVTPIVAITNPNDADVEIYKFYLKLFLVAKNGNQPIGTISNEEPKLIPKNGQLEFPLTLELEQKKGIDTKFISLLLQLVSTAAKGEEAEILIEGNLQIHSSLGNLSLPVSETRKIKLQK